MRTVFVINACLTALMVLAYLISFSYLLGYLRRTYTRTWMDLGAPSFPDKRLRRGLPDQMEALNSMFRALQFAFTGQHKAAHDRRLSALIWLVRVTIIFVFCQLAFELAFSRQTIG